MNSVYDEIVREQGEEKMGHQIQWAKTPELELMDFTTDWDLVSGRAGSQQHFLGIYSAAVWLYSKNNKPAAGEHGIQTISFLRTKKSYPNIKK